MFKPAALRVSPVPGRWVVLWTGYLTMSPERPVALPPERSTSLPPGPPHMEPGSPHMDPGPPHIDSLLLTREFARSYRRLRQPAQAHCDRALTRLLKRPASPGVRLRPLLTPAGYHELRVVYSDRAILRIEGSVAILIDVLSFNEIARLNARAARRVL